MKLENNLFADKASVNEFKAFVRKHPKLISVVRNKEKTWKEAYEEWYLLGEDHETWEQYKGSISTSKSDGKKDDNQAEMLKHLLGVLKNMDINQLQNNISQVSGAISSIQEIIGSFQKPNHPQHPPHQQHFNEQPFSFRKD
ncbi:hypothetical protein CIB95_02605 [Lottiidibacillus patelloidae]|uniref:Cytosolic protein n=1 Tax=Lottiidibacillus patelloidae TaxID=2670334 RepID=A0A263BYW7_9BACI|nr:hypothetical protein CIB95_02605 [Lottiidibacillus patelloidae]